MLANSWPVWINIPEFFQSKSLRRDRDPYKVDWRLRPVLQHLPLLTRLKLPFYNLLYELECSLFFVAEMLLKCQTVGNKTVWCQFTLCMKSTMQLKLPCPALSSESGRAGNSAGPGGRPRLPEGGVPQDPGLQGLQVRKLNKTLMKFLIYLCFCYSFKLVCWQEWLLYFSP